jgi:membrane-bound lytic murein transglycosylase D
MDGRTKTFRSFLVSAAVLISASCAVNSPAKFRTAFLPPAPRVATAEPQVDDPPNVPPNPYLHDVPAVLVPTPDVSLRRTRGDSLVLRADQSFQRGKRLYQSGDIPNARREFDAAVDSMLEAADQNPGERADYDRKLDEMVDAIHRFDLAGMGSAAGVEQAKFDKAPLEDILEMTFPVDPKLKDRVREQVAATVSQLPLTVNDTVLGYINYFSKRGRSTIVAAIRRSGRYRPMIQRILDEEGVPQELIHLAQAESGFFPRAVSSKAAGGMWQFMRFRGFQYGLEGTAYTDDRMDPEKATRAAAHHLHDLYTEFGDWYLAIAAYNCGPGVVEKAVERTGYADFWELHSRGVLPAQTINYVPIILAMTIMEKNAPEYGLDGLQLDLPLEYDTVEVSAPTSLLLVSDVTETPLPELAALNPAILKGIVPDKYSVHVPKGTGNQLVAALRLIPAERAASWRMYRVGSGETLAEIGKRYGATPASIMAANHLQSAEAMEGDRLLIPAVAHAESSTRRPPLHTASTAHHTVAVHHTKSKTASSKAAPARTADAHKPASKASLILARRAEQ